MIRNYFVVAAILLVLSPFLSSLFRSSRSRKGNTDLGPDIATARTGVDDGPTDSTTTANTNIAANFQLSTVYPNLAFAAAGMFLAPALNALSFGAGGLITGWFAQRNPDLMREDVTLHGFLAKLHNSSWLRKVAALLSLFTLAAVVTFEITFGARFLSALTGGAKLTYYFIIALFTLYLGWFSFIGGQRIAFSANQFLLTLAYAGIHLAIAILAFSTSSTLLGHPVGLFSLMLLLIAIWARLKDADRLRAAPQMRARFRHSLLLTGLMAITVAGLIWPVGTACPTSEEIINSVVLPLSEMTTWAASMMIVASVLMGAMAHFVDYSFWHRNTSLISSPTQAGLDPQEPQWLARLRRSLRVYVPETTIAWILPLLLGLLAALKYPDFVEQLSNPSNDAIAHLIQSILADEHLFAVLLGPVVIGGMCAIFVSTVDTYLASIGRLWALDLAKQTVIVGGERKPATAIAGLKEERARRFGVLCLFAIILAFLVLELLVDNTWMLIAVLFASFAPLLALSAPMILPTLTGRAIPDRGIGRIFLLASVCGAGVLGLLLGIVAAVQEAAPTSLIFWIANPVSIVGSWLVYSIGLLCVGEPLSIATKIQEKSVSM